MKLIKLQVSSLGYIQLFVEGLARGGWKLHRASDGGRMERNGQLLVLRTLGEEFRFRVFIYKVTGSSRGRPDERRIEITSTYQKGLSNVPRFRDVVLGFDPAMIRDRLGPSWCVASGHPVGSVKAEDYYRE
jgi:hypothetical protein